MAAGMDLSTYFQFAMALTLVLALFLLLAIGLKRIGTQGLGVLRGKGPRRLGIVEVQPVDTRRRLVLVRRDGVEHLILLGIEGDLVVETGIPAPPESLETPGTGTGTGTASKTVSTSQEPPLRGPIARIAQALGKKP